jgi:hypothetical protein
VAQLPVEVQGLNSLVSKLRNRAARTLKDRNTKVAVGYTAPYTVYVHENLQNNHPVGQAKFLEQPARQMASELAHLIASELRDGKTVGQALLKAGLRLQRAAQKLTPVDTGLLVRSAFTRLER